MKATSAVLCTAMLLLLPATGAFGQNSFNFDVEAYKTFLASHHDISSSQLLDLHPAGTFERHVPTPTRQPRRLDSIDLKYSLTGDEKALLGTNGFVVSERLAPGSFGQGFIDVWKADLPVFISTDAILHAVHMSYDEILKQTEENFIIPKLSSILSELKAKEATLDAKYQSEQAMLPSLKDLDLYVSVAQSLLDGSSQCYYPENAQPFTAMMQQIKAQSVGVCAPLFADNLRLVDFSQFTVRGHYTQSEALSRYFQSMMWLGRIEFYLSPPDNTWEHYTKAQIQRQAVAALLFAELTSMAGTTSPMKEIDNLLGFFVGEPDNVTLEHLNGLCSEVGVQAASELLDTTRYNTFHDALMTKSWAYQRILSQILMGHAFEPGSVQPAASFLPLGQRFIIDSFVSGNVVYDKIEFNNQKIWRELPSTLDVMFALGNDAAGQLLVPELNQYHYANNLAALRYLIDSYEPEYWRKTFFNGWLNAIRALNPPVGRSSLPSFMQTAAWWQEKMNTQLASWAELRHDNILYGKQSYTGGFLCSYPCGYVEPFPLFYERLDTLMRRADSFFAQAPQELQYLSGYFSQAARTCSTLTSISRKELDGTSMSPDDDAFLFKTIRKGTGCGEPTTSGWYPRLFYNPASELQPNLVVADVHTCPTDQSGVLIGWVLHVGTGPVNMAIVTADVPGIGPSAYIGPVSSFYKRVTTQFKRFTDEEWGTEYANAPSMRPSWVNSYLADKSGTLRQPGDMLATSVATPSGGGLLPTKIMIAQNYPNPFNPSTQIYFGLPEASYVSLGIYDMLGRRVIELVNGQRQAGFHNVVWNGTSGAGGPVASGVYFSRFVVTTGRGNTVFSKTTRMMLVR